MQEKKVLFQCAPTVTSPMNIVVRLLCSYAFYLVANLCNVCTDIDRICILFRLLFGIYLCDSFFSAVNDDSCNVSDGYHYVVAWLLSLVETTKNWLLSLLLLMLRLYFRATFLYCRIPHTWTIIRWHLILCCPFHFSDFILLLIEVNVKCAEIELIVDTRKRRAKNNNNKIHVNYDHKFIVINKNDSIHVHDAHRI